MTEVELCNVDDWDYPDRQCPNIGTHIEIWYPGEEDLDVWVCDKHAGERYQ